MKSGGGGTFLRDFVTLLQGLRFQSFKNFQNFDVFKNKEEI